MPIDINYFREEKGDIQTLLKSQEARGAKPEVVNEIIELDKQWRQLTFELNQLNKQFNDLNKKIGAKKKSGDETGVDSIIAEIGVIKAETKTKEETLKLHEKVMDTRLRVVGNIVHSSVPIAMDEAKNEIIKTYNSPNRIEKGQYHHHELLHMIDGYNSESGVRVAGHRAYFLKGVGVLLNQALINYGLNFLVGKGYTALQPPYFMRKEIMAETAQLEQFDEELYKVVSGGDAEDMYLIATSEQPISAYHRGDWLDDSQLPLSYAGLSTCFRKEAGSHGKDAWGIFRIHQFEKVEQFVVCAPDQSWDFHQKMIGTCEEFYQSLGLSYQIVSIVSGALNNAAAKKYDLEAYFPTFQTYRELVSASNCTDYQSRAMETRYRAKQTAGAAKAKDAPKDKVYVHMLNATLVATERTICCLLENYQTADGVIVPEVLRPYMGGMSLMKFVKPPPKHTAAAAAPTPTPVPAKTEEKSLA